MNYINEITVREIELFLAVAEEGSILGAAKKMFVSQPILSNTIRRLENKVGFPLFVRTNRGVILTDDGLELYSALHNTYHRFRVQMESSLDEKLAEKKNVLRIGCLGMQEVIDAAGSACNSYLSGPGALPLSVEYYHFYDLFSRLLCKELDAVFTLSFELEDEENFHWQRLRPVELQFLFPAAWNIRALDARTCAFLQGKPMFCEIHKGISLMKNYCDANGFLPGRIEYQPSFLTMLNRISKGEGFTLWGRALPRIYTERGDITAVKAAKPAENGAVYADIVWRREPPDPRLLSFLQNAKLTNYAGAGKAEGMPLHPGW